MNDDDQHDEPQRKTVGRPFEKNDSRINKSGRPRSYDEFRRIAQQIAGEDVPGADGNTLTRAEALLRQWARSKVPALQLAFAAYAFGPIPTKIEASSLVSGTRLILRWPDEDPEHPNYKPPGKDSW